MNKKLSKFLISSILIYLLTGCGPSYYYKYSAPTSATGVSCVQKCQETRNQCRQAVQLEEKNNHALAIAEQRNYQSCAVGRSRSDVRKYCSTGYNNYALNIPSQYSCESDFNQCFEICGGTIQKILESN